MAEIFNDWMVVDKQKKEDTTYITARTMEQHRQHVRNAGQENLQQQQKKQKAPAQAPLQADPKLKPKSKSRQLRRKGFNNELFLKEVKKLNKRARKMETAYKNAKLELIRECEELKKLKLLEGGREKKLPSDIRDIISLLDEYTAISETAQKNNHQRAFSGLGVFWWAFLVAFNIGGNRSKLKDEYTILAKMNKSLERVIPKYRWKPGYDSIVGSLENLQIMLRMQSGMPAVKAASAEERMKNKWTNFDPQKSRQLNGVGRKITTTADEKDSGMRWVLEKNVICDRKDWPLFAHEPNTQDIVQGAAGNCFFLAALASLPSKKIREMMLDHGDGNVTVRFYEKDYTTNKRRPVYVTVDKNVKINSTLDCLWVQVMEKAYCLFRQQQSDNRLFSQRDRKKILKPGE